MDRRKFLIGASGLAVSCTAASMAQEKESDLGKMPDYISSGAQLITDATPASDGFYFPAEWQPHDFTIMVLPPPQNWRGLGIPMPRVRRQWAAVANRLAEYEAVKLVVRAEDRAMARRLFSRDVEIVVFPVNDGWARDSGPTVLINPGGERRVAGFTFNGWGGKFPPYADDARLKAHLCQKFALPMYPIDLVLEGGAIAVDGQGTLLTTEQCLLNPNRNEQVDRSQAEKQLNTALGTSRVIWLDKGLEPDPITDGHIDGIAAFAKPGRVLLHTTEDRSDRNYKICRDARRRLQNATDAKDRELEIIELPLDSDLSHMNFYIANGCVLVPIAGRPEQDDRPMGILRDVFDDREVIGINSHVLAEGGGGIHCITQQVPMVG